MIQDQFTNLDISKQRKYQLRKRARGLCIICPRKLAKDNANFCSVHLKQTSSAAKTERSERVAAGEDLRKTTGNGKTKVVGKRKKLAA